MQTQTNAIKITKSKIKVNLFPEKKPKVRPFTPWEAAQEKEDAAIWLRPQRHFWGDIPTYPWCPPEPYVNFELKYKYE